MKSIRIFGLGAAIIFAVAAYAEQRHFNAGVQKAMGLTDPSQAVMLSAPIRPEWVFEGNPITMAAEISHTDDDTTRTYIWSTTKGRFHWFYDSDEVVSIIDGEVFVDDGINGERRLGPGAIAFFPAGSKATWYVPEHVRKVAVLKRPLPGPLASLIRWCKAAKNLVRPSATGFVS